MEKCFVMLKPGVINRRIAGEIISRLERKGLRLIGIKMMVISGELAAKHYQEHNGKSFYDYLISYITSGPVIVMVWAADDCIMLIRKLVGTTAVQDAVPGTIRGDFCLHTPHNIIHASDSPESGERETALFFRPEEIIPWTDELAQWF
ncbi:MAG: nucleoside-diphosphate kinase [Spirochaetaceae bacterium]|jgi:nucleoside-diphosphate kinase|nr:nucleoside-diphosphate kinase [Spirochaetaceae bacterium]